MVSIVISNHMEHQGVLFHVIILVIAWTSMGKSFMYKFWLNYFKSAILLEALAFALFKAFCC